MARVTTVASYNVRYCVEKIHSVSTFNNVETSYFTQLKMCYLMTTFPGHVLHRAVNNQDVIKMSDGHRNVVTIGNIFSVVESKKALRLRSLLLLCKTII